MAIDHTKGTPYPQEMRDRIAALLRAGTSNKAITAQTGVSSSTIKDVAGAIGVYRGPGGRTISAQEAGSLAKRVGRVALTQEQDQEILALARSNYLAYGDAGVRNLAARFGVAPETIASRLRKAGWRAPAGKLNLAPPSDSATPQPQPESPIPPVTPEDFAAKAGSAGPATALTLKESSQKINVLRHVVREGPFNLEKDATSASHRWQDVHLSGHELSHVLHGLKREGYLDFRHNQHSAPGYRMRRVEATVKGRHFIRTYDAKPGLSQNEANRRLNQNEKPYAPMTPQVAVKTNGLAAPSQPPSSPPQAHVEATPAPARSNGRVPGLWPLLAILRGRAAAKAEAAAKRDALLAAAALLEAVDKEEADRLVTRATVAEGEPFSSLEAEFLAYAEAAEERSRLDD